MLLAKVPEPPASPSPWHLCQGFHWRLHVHHRTRHATGLTISVVRESQLADVCIALRLRLLSDRLRKPVRNLALPSKESFPHERHLTVQLPAGVASKSAKFLPIAVPFARFLVCVSVDVQESCLEAGSRLGRDTQRFGRGYAVERFGNAYATGRDIAWLEETGSYSNAVGLNTDDTKNPPEGKGCGIAGETVPHNLGTLLESCNGSEQGHGQAPDTTFSDVIMIVGSGSNTSTFNLHRCVLALASPVFRAMLTSDMLERRTGTVTLPKFTPSAVAVAVRHMYGSPVDVTQHAFELYDFAHQFDIASLHHTARKSILQSMGLRSCAYILRFGVLFRDEEVVNAASGFIATKFTEIMVDEVAAREMHHIPKETFIAILEDDAIKAAELEILLLALRWLTMNEGTSLKDVLNGIRWGLLSPEILVLADCAGLSTFSPELRATTDETVGRMENYAGQESYIERRRCLGKPNATLWVPLITKPPAVFFPTSRSGKADKKQRTRPRVGAGHSTPSESSFNRGNLRWTLRANLAECNSSSCCGSRLSASLWLEEGDDGRVWTDHGGDPLPVRVLANLMVSNHLGGLLHVVPIDVILRSAGWGNGWCVRDLIDGARHGLADYGEAVQVAVEIRKVVLV